MVRRAKRRDRIADLYQRLADQVQFLAHWTILPFTVAAIIRFEELLHLKLRRALPAHRTLPRVDHHGIDRIFEPR